MREMISPTISCTYLKTQMPLPISYNPAAMAKKTIAQKVCLALLSFLHPKTVARNGPRSQGLPPLADLPSEDTVCDLEGGLLRSSSTFPYFMLVALEAGGFLRGLLLLLLCPLLCCVSDEVGIKVMVMVSFCGVRKAGFRVGRAVLPKFFLEEVGLEGFEVLMKSGRRVCVSRMPRVMVEVFLKDYLEVEVVVGRELGEFWGFYTGLMEEERLMEDLNAKDLFRVEEKVKRKWSPLPREKYPRSLVFHDGRMAFRPTPTNTLLMFMWLPLGVFLAILRLLIGLTLPYKLSTPVLEMTGMRWRLKGSYSSFSKASDDSSKGKGQLFACNHRTLIDPIYISIALNKPVRAVSYSLSRVSEILAPIKTVRLTRNREADGKMMGELLSKGELVVVCPEGTTCREPYLLRFSPLFTELSDEIVPVALDAKVSMFYATTAGGWKCFDSLYYLMNPSMCYEVEFLEKIDTSGVRMRKSCSIDMANYVQREIGKALEFECTKLTRKDKYMMLAGNDGSVAPSMRMRESPGMSRS
ncbi:probable glycerol-3-phosphate acyltransferase 3 [Typha latifolia]|uniref:probable glycerol-3-phosphate acyltransferase 3 n=1 Tax=Typha latifolia TaxID=4733 RepID=UPI003C2F0DF5